MKPSTIIIIICLAIVPGCFENSNTDLDRAIKSNSEQGVRDALAHGADINSKYKGDRSPLLTAIAEMKPDMVKLLIEKGADVNARGANGDRPLPLVVGCRLLSDTKSKRDMYGEMMTTILAAKPDLNARNGQGLTSLIIAITFGKDADVVELVKAGADINAADESGNTPLMWTVMGRKMSMLRYFIAMKADINKPSGSGVTPLGMAKFLKNEQAVRILAASGGK